MDHLIEICIIMPYVWLASNYSTKWLADKRTQRNIKSHRSEKTIEIHIVSTFSKPDFFRISWRVFTLKFDVGCNDNQYTCIGMPLNCTKNSLRKEKPQSYGNITHQRINILQLYKNLKWCLSTEVYSSSAKF